MKESSSIPILTFRLFRRLGIGLCGIVIAVLLGALPAHSFSFDTGNSDLSIRWDNTIKYTAAYRVEKQSNRLISGVNTVNQDAGDRNFDRGFISNRFDLLSEFDFVFKKTWGVRVSAAGWYDSIYNEGNDNDLSLTNNTLSASYDSFTDKTEKQHGRDAEILDAFVFLNTQIGDTGVNLRAGQFAMQWGETFFFGANGIAGGMAPVDVIKLLTVPSSQFKEILRPVPQASVNFQFGSGLTVSAYYQFEWEKTILPSPDSYFGSVDHVNEGGESLIVGPGMFFVRGNDKEAKSSGQGGLQVRFPVGFWDFGLYATRYHDKTPQLYIYPLLGYYNQAYHEGIESYGASASSTFDIVNFATEVSFRRNTPLTSNGVTLIPPIITGDNNNNPGYAVGRTLHAVASAFVSLGPSFISQEATFIGEIAWNRRLKITDNPEALNPNATRNGVGFRCIYEPVYRQVFSGVDMIVNLGFSYFPKGKSSSYYTFGPDKGGDYTIGVTTTYLDAWRFKLAYTCNYGPLDTALDANNSFTMKQSYADRDFISFSFYRTF